ncbi:MAG: hypothetical protein Q6K80_06400 [Thermostichus sp. DG_1_6_bins_120]
MSHGRWRTASRYREQTHLAWRTGSLLQVGPGIATHRILAV